MNTIDIPYLRLFNQQLLGSKYKTAKEIVGWMGAMQAQDYSMAKWAIGVRLPGLTEKTIASAIDKGEIFRTHLMRPTWHLVTADDIYWMLELTAPQIKVNLRSRDKIIGFDQRVYEKTNFIIENALRGGEHLLKEELVAEFEMANVATDNNKPAHYLMHAEINGIICSGKIRNNKPTFALLRDRVPIVKSLSREESLRRLAWNYFMSHGPATLHDFVWWSGLPVNAAKQGLESIKDNLVSEIIDNKTYWFSNALSIPEPDRNTVFLLPAYDEFIISYRDRTASLPSEMHGKAVSSNGIFKPIIVINGQVAGLWRKITQKDKVVLETKLLQPVSPAIKNQLAEIAVQFEHYLNKKVEIVDANH